MTTPTSVRGFVLVAALWLLVLVGVLGTFSYWAAMDLWRTHQRVASQLEARVWAENGLEYARSLLPGLDLNATLMGPDGQPCPSSPRNPAPFDHAVRRAPSDWERSCDDGFPMTRGGETAATSVGGRGDRVAAVRFSNNPEEDPRWDEDRIVLVRSLAAVPLSQADPASPEVKNSALLIEARFRQERVFEPSAAVSIVADEAFLLWSGDAFSIDGKDRAAVGAGTFSGGGIRPPFTNHVGASQLGCFQSGEGTPLFEDFGLDLLSHPDRRRLLSDRFWRHFREALPAFDRGPEGGLAFLREPGEFSGTFKGFLAVEGNLTLIDEALVQGLLVHLGSGSLTIEGRARIEGALWLTNLNWLRPGLQPKPVNFAIGDHAEISFDRDSVENALAQLPATLLGWRILFPEMSDGEL